MGGVDFRAEQHFLLATLGRTQLGLCVAKKRPERSYKILER
jgi:hypothetical protein